LWNRFALVAIFTEDVAWTFVLLSARLARIKSRISGRAREKVARETHMMGVVGDKLNVTNHLAALKT
jgi:hypothetical protein